VEALLSYLSAGRHLERIADYATNIAEDVTYMIEGSIVRHGRRRQDRSATTG
jgi:phosphate transport system protein